MASVVYTLCVLTSMACAIMLLRSYRASRDRLLLWSALGFIGLALNNTLLFVDLVAVPTIDLRLPRALTAAASMLLVLCGLIWNDR